MASRLALRAAAARGTLLKSTNPTASLLLKYNQNVARFSSDSHDDFAPKRKIIDSEEEALKLIKVRLLISSTCIIRYSTVLYKRLHKLQFLFFSCMDCLKK